MHSDQLATLGRALYGDRWQTALAADLNVADRTMRRWLSGESPIAADVASELRELLLKRLGRMGGLIGYTIDPSSRTMLHHQTGAWFRYDDDENITLLNSDLLESDVVPLISFGAEEALRQQRERDPSILHVWADTAGKGQANMEIEVEYRGCVITYLRIRMMADCYRLNLSSNIPHLFNRLGGRTVIVEDYHSIENAIEKAKRHVDAIH